MSNSCEIILKKISALFNLNNEIISEMKNTKSVQFISYKLVQENQSNFDQPPKFKVEKKIRKVSGSSLLKKKLSISIKPHLFSEENSKNETISGFEAIIAQNVKQMNISNKYKKFGENSTAFEELQILLQNFESIQEGLGQFQKHFIEERPDNFQKIQNELNQVNQIFDKMFKNYSFNDSIPESISQSSILNEAFEKKILDSEEISEKISKWIPNKNLNLLFRASKDGWNSNDFHQKCDNKGPTLTIAKDKNGNIFGGYTSKSWNSSSSYVSDPNSFLFSLKSSILSKPEKFDINPSNTQHAIYCNSSYGPTFGGGNDLYISSNSNNNYSGSNFGVTYQNNTGNSHPLTGQRNFQLIEYEVFQFT